ncbi:MAG: ABC transporter permease [Gemmatimonadales bacterium]|nr:ABC transporter permease [Gemmatimonadales bacterium]
MLSLTRLLRRLRTLVTRKRFDADVEEELRFHVEMETEKHLAWGMDPHAARAAALRDFGSRPRMREEVRDAHGMTPVDDLVRDLRFAVRSLRRAPGYTAVALLTLALGIGGSVAVFTMVNAALIQPLPFPAPDRVMILWETAPDRGEFPVSIPNFRDWKEQNRSFATLAAFATSRQNLLWERGPIRATVVRVTGDFFAVLDVPVHLGRPIVAADHTPDAPRTVVLGYGFWQRAFGGDPGIIGQPIGIGSGRDYVVVGVMPPTFDYPRGAEAWASRDISGNRWSRNGLNEHVIGRLKDGVSEETARRDMNLIATRLKQLYPSDEENWATATVVRSLGDDFGRYLKTYLILMQAAVLCVLLVGCANLASTGLARGIRRTREMGIRTALGASRGRLLRQLLAEHILLGLIGGGLGLALSIGLVRFFVWLAPGGMLPTTDLRPDALVLGGGLALSVGVGLLIGILPALFGSRFDLRGAIGGGGTGSAVRRARVGWSLVAAEVAISMILLVGGGVLVHSFVKVLAEDPGVRTDGIVTAQIALPVARYGTERETLPYWDRLLERVRVLPGVRSTAAGSATPLGRVGGAFVEIEGREGQVDAGYRLVTEDYFATMGISLIRGRAFLASDDSTREHVTVVNRTMAEAYWPGEDPIGKRIRSKGWDNHAAVWFTVVGVIGDVKYFSLESDARAEHYVYHRQRPERLQNMTLVVHTTDNQESLAPLLRMALREADSEVPADISTMSGRVEDTLQQRRFVMTLLGGFAAFALVLAAIGIYGVLSYVTTARTREIGIRVALGAGRQGILALVLAQAAGPVGIGLLLGAAGAAGLVRFIESMLFGIAPLDPPAFAGAFLLLALTAGAACLVPARRALRVDPMIAIRAD